MTVNTSEGGKYQLVPLPERVLFRGSYQSFLDNNVVFHGVIDKQHSEIDGLIQSYGCFHPTKLKKKGKDYKGKWKLSAFQCLQPESLFLNIERGNSPEDEYPAYPLLGSLWCNEFKNVQRHYFIYRLFYRIKLQR